MSRRAASYHPLRAVVGWTLLGAVPWLLLRPRADAAAAGLEEDGGLASAFLARLLASVYQEAMLLLLIGALLYCAAQIPALRRDERRLSRPPGSAPSAERGDALRAIAAGRSLAFWRAEDDIRSRYHHLRSWTDLTSRPVALLVWVFPMLGFLGTVVGLSLAVAALGDQALNGGAMNAETFAPILAGLDTAFDTTIQGIVSALLLAGAATALDLRWKTLERLAVMDAPPSDSDGAPGAEPDARGGAPVMLHARLAAATHRAGERA